MEFDKHFQKHFAAHVLRDGSFLDQVRRDLDFSIFSDENLQRVMRLCLDFFDKEKKAPGDLVYQILESWRSRELIKEDNYIAAKAICDDLMELALVNKGYLLGEFDRFIRHQMFVSRSALITDAFRHGDIDQAENLIKEVFSFRPSKNIALGRELSADPTSRILRREQQNKDRVWTLIPEIDQYVDGLSVGEIGILQSQRTSGGKSAGLGLLARNFAMQRKKSIIFTLEMTEEQYEDRLDQTIAGLQKHELRDSIRIQKKVTELLRRGGAIRIVQMPAYRTRISDMRESVEMIRKVHNFIPDIVLIDYAGLLAPETPALRNDIYSKGEEIFSHLLGWMQEDSLRCWTACQSGRHTTESAVAVPEDIAGSIAQSQIAQIILSLNRTPDEEANNEFRIYIGKNRDGVSRVTVPIKSDLSRMQLWKYNSAVD